MSFRDAHPDYPEYSWDQALWHIFRAEQTEGVTEDAMLRTAIVESAAAIVVALFEVAGAIQQLAGAQENEVAAAIDRVASAAEKK